MLSILNYIEEEPVDLTYLGIGSSPHCQAGQVLEGKYDQLIPQCFHETIVHDKKSVRILHFDSHFDEQVEFLNTYFEKWNLVRKDSSLGYHWIGETLEVFVFAQRLEHTDHLAFFAGLSNCILNTKGKLVIQEYTGYSLSSLNETLYKMCSQKEKYKRRILLDMTFGTDSGCCTDMLKIQPFYDYDGNFLNFHFMTEAETKRWIHISLKLDDLLRVKYTGLYCQTLNSMHVDYRRRLKGETIMYGSPDYSNDASSEEIMKVLQEKLSKMFDLLLLLRGANQDSLVLLQELFQNYKNYDPYKWYDAVYKLIERN